MRKLLLFLICIFTITYNIKADIPDISEPTDLYGLSAVLLDADSKDVLYGKNIDEPMAVASTTKVLTCLITLEECDLNEIVTISELAASQPDVQMHVESGDQYYLEDLLKAMMLESYNDVSVAIAEHVAGTVEAFSILMNEKAKNIGCNQSYFITPNGLDAEINGKENKSTARDMAYILCEAIKNQDFLNIVQTLQWEVKELNGKRSVNASNKNQLLQSYDGVIAGKTGFTNKAGYCYVGAANRDERTFIIVTLGSGWPPNKSYKWRDAMKLFEYGFDSFHYKTIDFEGVVLPEEITVNDGIDETGNNVSKLALVYPEIEKILLRDDETYTGKVYIKKNIGLPIFEKEVIGYIDVYRNDEFLNELNILSNDTVKKKTLWHKIWDLKR